MISLFVSFAVLIIGYLIYGRIAEKVSSAGGGQIYLSPLKEPKAMTQTWAMTVTATPVTVDHLLFLVLLLRYSFICYSGEVARITL